MKGFFMPTSSITKDFTIKSEKTYNKLIQILTNKPRKRKSSSAKYKEGKLLLEQYCVKNSEKYETSLQNTPFFAEDIPSVKIDYKGLIAYAKKKGVNVCDLSDEEKQPFVEIPLSELQKRQNFLSSD